MKTQPAESFIARFILILFSLLGALHAQTAQTKPDPDSPEAGPSTTIRAVSESVVLDLIVRDKKGRPVRDLNPGEIEVYENGVKQEVTSFRFVGEAIPGQEIIERAPVDATSGNRADLAELSGKVAFDPFRQVNLVVLVFERLPDTARHTARQSALHFLRTGVQKNTLVAVFAIDNRLYLLQNFSNDLGLLKEAVLEATSGYYGEFDSQSTAAVHGQMKELSRRLELQPTEAAVVATGGPGQLPAVAEVQEAALDEITLNVLRHAQRIMRYQRGHVSVAALEALVHEQGNLAGRKTLVLFSAGIEIPPDVVHRFRMLISEANRANVSIYTVDARGLVSEELMANTKYWFNEAVNASRNQMLTGLGRMVSRDDVMLAEWAEASLRMNKQGTLDDLARSTGGFLMANTNDARVLIDRVAEDIRTYYEIAYTPSFLEYDGTFRSIEVKVTRPGVQVQSRSGYFALPPSGESPTMPFEIPMLVALNSGSLPEHFPHHSRILRFDGDTKGVQYVFLIEVPLATFSFVENEEEHVYDARFSTMILLKDRNGRIVTKFTQDYPLQGPSEKVELVKNGSVIFSREYELAPGTYTVESAVVDQLSRRVSTRRTRLFVRQPEEGLRMSSLAVIRRVDPVRDDEATDDPFLFQNGRIVPNLGGAIPEGPDSKVGLYCVIYPAPDSTKRPELTLEIVQNGQVVARGSQPLSSTDAQGRIKFVGTIPISELSPGRYEVRAWARQGKSAVREHAFFSVASNGPPGSARLN